MFAGNLRLEVKDTQRIRGNSAWSYTGLPGSWQSNLKLSVHGRLLRRILIENKNNKLQGDSLHPTNLKIVKFERVKLLLDKLA